MGGADSVYERSIKAALDRCQAELKAARESAQSRKQTLLAIAQGCKDPQLLAEMSLAVYPGE